MSESDSIVSQSSVSIVDPNSARGLYEQALAESRTNVRDEAKKLIAARITEIERLRALTARAEADLAKLLDKSVEEIAMMRF